MFLDLSKIYFALKILKLKASSYIEIREIMYACHYKIFTIKKSALSSTLQNISNLVKL